MDNKYLQLLRQTLVGIPQSTYGEYKPIISYGWGIRYRIISLLDSITSLFGYRICKKTDVTQLRKGGRDWPTSADSMIGLERMDSLHECLEKTAYVIGDFVECGVWRGGASVYMKAFAAEHKLNKRIWLFDSFEGLPRPTMSEDAGDKHYKYSELEAPKELVEGNFRKYGLMGDDVVMIDGYFADTLLNTDVGAISLLRLDGDMYQSTIECLQYLYPKLAVGGICILDDYHAVEGCKKAFDFYFWGKHKPQLNEIDGIGVWFRKNI